MTARGRAEDRNMQSCRRQSCVQPGDYSEWVHPQHTRHKLTGLIVIPGFSGDPNNLNGEVRGSNGSRNTEDSRSGFEDRIRDVCPSPPLARLITMTLPEVS